MLEINLADVAKVLENCKPHLIFFGVVVVLAIIAMVAARNMDRAKKVLVRKEAGIAALVALALTVNMICWGPMSTLLSLATGDGTITKETSEKANELCTEIAEEGIVMLKNEDDLLPMQANKKLNVFGWGSTNPCYGGTGSGSISDKYEKVTLLQGLENAGFELNDELSQFYTDYRAARPAISTWAQDWTLPEPPVDTYSDDLINNAVNFSDTALVVIARVGGEGSDLPRNIKEAVATGINVAYTNNSEAYEDFGADGHYLQLSQTEADMVELVCSKFDNVVVVYNGANALELGFVNDFDQIKSVIWCPGAGQNGFAALGKILNGEVNPSAKTADTFVYDLTATPTWNNFGDYPYENMEEFKENKSVQRGSLLWDKTFPPSFVNYSEGIYVGYKFWETAAEEGLINYDECVLYPFGYGLSYTKFTQEMGEITESNETITFEVTVTNTGSVAGKDVVQVYYNPPYTNGGIEKASANLVAFAKTNLLAPGESEKVTISFSTEDMASYDTYGKQAYVLEAGDYGISIRANSHEIIEEQTYTVSKTIVYDESNPRSTDEVAATNQFANVEGDVTYLSRADGFANYEEATAAPTDMNMPQKYKEAFLDTDTYNPQDHNDESDEMPVTGAKNDVKLAALRGLEYDDPLWEDLLDELSLSDMDTLIALGGYQTPEIASIDKVQTTDCDGPASINNNFTRTSSIGFPAGVMIANTWNLDIAEKFGESIGTMADEMNVSGWYAPAINTHRSAFGGRNYEYYSEDGLLAGKVAARAVIGAEKHGVYAYLKHYALNDQETNRDLMLCTWSNEQAIREIYLKPFEIAVKEGGAKAMMCAFNYIGSEWAGASSALCQKVLRDEWGFRGFVLTDYFANTYYMNADQGIRNGTDSMLIAYDVDTNHVKDQTSATGVQAMREASHNILYTVVNSRAYDAENLNAGLAKWKIAAIVIDIVLAAVVVVLEILAIKSFRKSTDKVQTEKRKNVNGQ